ncbi:MAG: hypothetical protein JWP76_4295 [Dactylosporangium sp.]|jgi:hypothetical protein|nr:hypothetical protein [Dactylosporangium sp.]
MAELMAVPLPSAGHRAPRLPTPRWLLLAFTLLGLAAMHTIGHTGAGHRMAMPERPAIHRLQTTAIMLTELAMHVAAPVEQACPIGCAHVSDGLPAGGHPGSWSACLAILAALAVAVLVGWLVRAASVRHGANRPVRPVTLTPRGPPRPGVGLRLADLAVLRR